MKHLLYLFLLIPALVLPCDLLIFSYNRPMQLYALLESIEQRAEGFDAISILLRVDSQRYADSYKEVFKRFPRCKILLQNQRNRQDFFDKVMQFLHESQSKYVSFAVDDLIFTHPVSIKECCAALDDEAAHGFFLRLGSNTVYSMASRPMKVPCLSPVNDCYYRWTFSEGDGDWNYMHTLDLTMYKKDDILTDIRSLHFFAPNSFEGEWMSATFNEYKNKKGLCFNHSVVVNIPMTQVQRETPVPWMKAYTVEGLQTLFEAGKKIDIGPLYQLENDAAHFDYWPKFIDR